MRAGLAAKLASARAALPGGVDLRVVEGHRSTADQQEIFEEYTDTLRVRYPGVDAVATA
ncbi:M15 family metallopeptidase domain-containing protein [Amycolatopsis panacis]|uniref:M15 family metallopeptidase n=1 Tax=Amycolatopsis panacis TaxID=2340917 RepID=UPI0011C3F9D4|nr:M15 family metallopeptidase [Amycolatopsis panacis]